MMSIKITNRHRLISTSLIMLVLSILNGNAQQPPPLPQPTLWFDFHNYQPFNKPAHYIDAVNGFDITSLPPEKTTDRFMNSNAAIDLSGANLRAFILVNEEKKAPRDYDTRLYGALHPDSSFPKNFTVSLWVYVDSTEKRIPRMILADGRAGKSFGLVHVGPDIYLRRMTFDTTRKATFFQYYLGAPASFDAGTGWYHLILVMGERDTDKAKFTKVYIGKPKKVKYDISGPRTVSSTNDPLASDFGGAYVFTGINDSMRLENDLWVIGNSELSDHFYKEHMRSVKRIDDLAVWKIALSDAQANYLFNCQKYNPANSCWDSPPAPLNTHKPGNAMLTAKSSSVSNDTTVSRLPLGEISVYPNPTTGDLFVKLPPNSTRGFIELTISDLNGSVVHRQQITNSSGTQTITIKNIKSLTGVAGMYFLKLTSAYTSQTFKIAVQ